MDYTFYTVEKKESVAIVKLNRPEKKNAMITAAWTEPVPLFKDLNDDPSIRAVVLTSSSNAFCVGLDLVGVIPDFPAILDKEQFGGVKRKIYEKVDQMQAGMNALEECRKPVIAAISGPCIGAGLDLASACDIRVASKDAYFSLREAAVGFVADMGVLQRIPHIIGQGNTRELAYTAKNIDAQRAYDMHLVNQIFETQDDCFQGAMDMALEIAGNSPLAVQASKDVLNAAIRPQVYQGLDYVAAKSATVIPSKDLFEAVAAFSEKRKPNFPGE
jgi:enoyl-CoA hydratase